ncbi:Cyclin CCL1 [Apiospora kogelbergensis]|uniref:Cyclin CCL1 n=1 Tax=Apiospora kogelbergensis TaxID=1337665 RepID=A0AAW0Q8A8_9PEZI
MATEDARYRQSSQFRLWSFSTAHLASLRNECNSLAQKAISARLQSASPNDPLPEFLTPAEELSLVTHYTVELLRAAAFIELPTEIRATAAIFLRRFYLLKTCLFFGCKAEGHYMRLSKFADKFPNTTSEEVLAAEYVLSQGIRFAFDVRHPFRALEGAVMELRRLGDFENRRIDKAHGKAREILKFSPLVTDAYFHYTPSQIMLAALATADEGLVERMLGEAFAAEGVTAKDRCWELIKACRAMLEKEPPEKMNDNEERKAIIKPLNRKLKKCRDPDRVDLVALQKARREQAMVKKPKIPVKADGAVFGESFGDGRESKRRKTETEE